MKNSNPTLAEQESKDYKSLKRTTIMMCAFFISSVAAFVVAFHVGQSVPALSISLIVFASVFVVPSCLFGGAGMMQCLEIRRGNTSALYEF
jgi:hypothetical protein